LHSLALAALLLTTLPLSATSLEIRFAVPELDARDRIVIGADSTRLRYGGSTDPQATLTLNGERIRVWPSGAFAGLLTGITTGESEFVFEAIRGGETAIRMLHVRRPAPPPPLPPFPAAIDEHSITPRDPIWVVEGDEVEVTFRGSPGGHATATLGAGASLALTESARAPGLYRGTHRVTGDENWNEDEITVRLAVARGTPGRIEITRRSMLWSLDPNHLPVRVVRSPDRRHCPLYIDVEETDRLIDLPEGTHLLISGQRDLHWRVRLTPDREAWVRRNGSEQFTDPLPSSTPRPRGRLIAVESSVTDRFTTISLDLEQPIPPVIFEHPERLAIELRLMGLTEAPSDTPASAGIVRSASWSPAGDEAHALTLDLSKTLWGWELLWAGNRLNLRLIHPPAFASAPASPLTGLRIMLDPGHGGNDSGAVGSTGLEEQEVNLQMARLVRSLLRERGAVVTTLRDDADLASVLPLNARVDATDSATPDLFLSLHSNSVPFTSDPLVRAGVSVFSSHPREQALCDAIRRHVVATGVHDDGTRMRTFRVTRPTRRPSVLVELLYLPNPDDEMLLLDADRRAKFAEAIVAGVEEWLGSVSEGDGSP
jgi:N-acetylmuramoyl-L-alanine amidase